MAMYSGAVSARLALERVEDIPVLARHFLNLYSDEFKNEKGDISFEAMQKLVKYHWPGNVRELQNVIERAIINSGSSLLGRESIQIPMEESMQKQESLLPQQNLWVTFGSGSAPSV
jgi:DNA-binding NtrC family response regulator